MKKIIDTNVFGESDNLKNYGSNSNYLVLLELMSKPNNYGQIKSFFDCINFSYIQIGDGDECFFEKVKRNLGNIDFFTAKETLETIKKEKEKILKIEKNRVYWLFTSFISKIYIITKELELRAQKLSDAEIRVELKKCIVELKKRNLSFDEIQNFCIENLDEKIKEYLLMFKPLMTEKSIKKSIKKINNYLESHYYEFFLHDLMKKLIEFFPEKDNNFYYSNHVWYYLVASRFNNLITGDGKTKIEHRLFDYRIASTYIRPNKKENLFPELITNDKTLKKEMERFNIFFDKIKTTNVNNKIDNVQQSDYS